MIQRLQTLINVKAGGRQIEFSRMLGWSPQYLSGILRGTIGFGLNPVKTILDTFRDVEPNWLLFGRGQMLTRDSDRTILDQAFRRIDEIYSLGRLLPVMDAGQRQRYSDTLLNGHPCDFSPEEVLNLRTLLRERTEATENIIRNSMNKSIHRNADK